MITVTDLHKVYPPARRNGAPVAALRGVSLSVPRGHVHGIVGPSGSGKSTLGRCLTLLETPTSGSVHLDGHELTGLGPSALRAARRRIGVVFQAFNLLDSRTAAGNVELPLQLAGEPRHQRRARALEALERVGLAHKADAHPRQLSGGQQQRVAIARALVARPELLICDEATSALDPESTQQIVTLLRKLTDDLALTTVLITHQREVVAQACDSVSTLSDGVITRTDAVRTRVAEVAA